MTTALVTLVIGLAATGYLALLVLPGRRSPMGHVWPPDALDALRAVEIWVVSVTAFGAAYLLAAMTAGALPLPGWLSAGAGGLLLGLGMLTATVSAAALGLAQTSGAAGPLRTRGPYAISRHPQYLGHAITLTGWLVWTGSLMALPLTLAFLAGLALAARAEDRWLAAAHGADWHRYAGEVRALIGRRRRPGKTG